MKKNILILGASSDIGISLVKILLKNKFKITAHCNRNSKVLSKISKLDQNILIIKKDLSKLNDKNIKNFCKKNFNKSYGSFVNLVGYTDNKSFKKTSINNLMRSILTNGVIPLVILRHVLNSMIRNEYGRILNCSSIGVKFGGGVNSFNYSYSKHMSEFIPAFVKKLISQNIIMNNLRIGVTDTKIHNKLKRNKNTMKKRLLLIPSKRMASTSEIANYIFFLISENNSYLTNETITVSGGE